jgi:hypothetical protein
MGTIVAFYLKLGGGFIFAVVVTGDIPRYG